MSTNTNKSGLIFLIAIQLNGKQSRGKKNKPSISGSFLFAASNPESVVTDKIIGTGKHGVQSILHIHPNANLMEINNQSVNFQINKKTVNIELQSNGKLEIAPSTYHPEFGLSIENKKIIINYNDFLPFEAIIKVSW